MLESVVQTWEEDTGFVTLHPTGNDPAFYACPVKVTR